MKTLQLIILCSAMSFTLSVSAKPWKTKSKSKKKISLEEKKWCFGKSCDWKKKCQASYGMKKKVRAGCWKIRDKFKFTFKNLKEFKKFTIDDLRNTYPDLPSFANKQGLAVWDSEMCVDHEDYGKWLGAGPEIKHSECVTDKEFQTAFETQLPFASELSCNSSKKELLLVNEKGVKSEVTFNEKSRPVAVKSWKGKKTSKGWKWKKRPQVNRTIASSWDKLTDDDKSALSLDVVAHTQCCGDARCNQLYWKNQRFPTSKSDKKGRKPSASSELTCTPLSKLHDSGARATTIENYMNANCDTDKPFSASISSLSAGDVVICCHAN